MTSRLNVMGNIGSTELGLRALDGTLLPLEKVNATGSLSNGLFGMLIEQHYTNTSSRNIETVYTFALMPDAVLLGLELQIGERRLSGTAVPVAKARQDYEEALEDGNTSALLEKSDDGLYTVSLGNLLAGESAVIGYRYAQPISSRNGNQRITIPAAVAPRYGNPGGQVQPHQVPESDVLAEYLLNVSVRVEGNISADLIDCPTHKTRLTSEGDSTRIDLQGAYLDRDVVIILKLPQRAAVYVTETDHGWIAYAPVIATAPELEEASANLSLRIVIDCSGSMQGESIKSARRGAMRAVEVLGDTDEFSITRFGSTCEHCFAQLKPAVRGSKAHALHYLHSTDANLGGTEMAAALNAAAGLPGAFERSDVLMVTDGQIWDVDTLVASARASGLRYFIVGAGSSPSHKTLTRLAESTGGSYIAVTPGEDIEQAIVEQLARMRQPRAVSPELLWSAPSPEWQTSLPQSLFRQEAVVVFAGLKNKPNGALTLQYTTVDGKQIAEPFSVNAWPGDPELLLRVGTALRIQEAEAGDSKQLTDDEITELAVTHNLVSQHTNYIVTLERAESEKPVDLPQIVKVKQMMSILSEKHQEISYQDMPAFLRRQSEPSESKTTMMMDRIPAFEEPALEKFAAALNRRMEERNSGVVPSRIEVLDRLGIPEQLMGELINLVRRGEDEFEVVFVLLLLLADMGQLSPLSENNLRIVKELHRRISPERLGYLQDRLRYHVVDYLAHPEKSRKKGVFNMFC